MKKARVGGIELSYLDSGRAGGRSAVICLHDSGATAASWRGLEAALADRTRVISYDRRGWGGSEAPQPYTRTTIPEQAQDALRLLDHLGLERAIACGGGLGAIAAVDLAVREPERLAGVVMIEPPLLSLVPGATEGLSADVKAAIEAAEEGGIQAAAWLYANGELAHLGPGADRIAAREEIARDGQGGGHPALVSPVTLFAEIAAVPAWTVPFEQLGSLEPFAVAVTGSESPEVLRQAAAALNRRLPELEHVEVPGDPYDGPALAEVIERVASAN